MEIISNLGLGFSISLSLNNLWYCFVGCLIGTFIGVLPGLGITVTIALLMPLTFKLDPTTAIIMLAGIYYGAQYGGSTTSILVNIPGEASSVVTCLDGYQMARQGRAGPALGISAFGSFIAGTIATFGLAFLAPPLAQFALKFGPAEYFGMMSLGLIAAAFLGQGSMLKSIMMVCFGLILGTVGRDLVTSFPRFTFGIHELEDGLGLVPVLIGLFGVGEILNNLETTQKGRQVYREPIRGLLPSWQEWKESIGPILRGSVLGFFLGIIPGGGAGISSYASYAVEKKLSKTPGQFGKGVIQGVAGPEAANNAGSQGAFVPLLTLGIPANSVMALFIGALMIHGIQPGPLIMTKAPQMFWGVITSMYVGNVMLILLNLPLIGMWVQLLRVPYRIMFPSILLICLIGTYSMNNSVFELFLMGIFGIVGYLFKRLDLEMAPMILAFVLGPFMEDAFKQALITSHGSLEIFIRRPISATFIGVILIFILLQTIPRVRRYKEAVPKEEL
jgi:putative tricarboxylic transport membrane protein